MGTEVAWVPLAMAALGAGATYVNQKQVSDRQDDILGRQIQQNASRQAEADRAVAETLRERAASSAEPDRQLAGAQYLQAVRAAQGNATQGLGQAGAVSSAYRDAANDAAMGIGDYASKTAGLMARIDAPTQQRNREALAGDDLRSRLQLIGRKASGDDFLSQLKLRLVRPNPWLAMGGSLLSGAASGMASGAGAGAAASTSGGQFGSEAGSWFSDPALWRAG